MLVLAFRAAAVAVHAKPARHVLPATPKTVTWGRYDPKTPPVLRINSGDIVEVHTLITSTPERLQGAGLPAEQVEQSLRDIVTEVKDRGPGGHILTGPIYVEGAEVGDVLEVRLLSIDLAIPYAYNAFGPLRGFLPDDFPYAKMRIIQLDRKRMVAQFACAVKGAGAPPGICGVAAAAEIAGKLMPPAGGPRCRVARGGGRGCRCWGVV